jgi:hypothetical protein
MKLHNVSRSLSTAALILGMLGVGMIFIWGPPQPDFDPYERIITEKGADPKVIADRDLHILRSRQGLTLVGIGMLLELVVVWIPVRVNANAD